MSDSAPTYREVDAKSITRLRGSVDPWFLCRYGMNLYRGCAHGCRYCDGRAERYYVDGDFARDITVKRNAVEVLERELGRAREPGFVFLGGGVCDAYQPAEAHYRLARGVLELARARRLPVHVLTKSSLVERDLDLLADIQRQTRAILSFSIQTDDDTIRADFEPGAAAIGERLRLLRRAKQLGLGTGAMAMPVLPGISDTPEAIDRLVATLADAGVDFVCFGGLTLRPGAQKDAYLQVIQARHPALVDGYQRAYRVPRVSGAPDPRYLERVNARFAAALAQHGLPARAPRRLFAGVMPIYAEIAVLLEHREQERRLAGQPTAALGRAGYAIQTWAAARIGGRRGAPYAEVERDFIARVEDGSLAEVPGVTTQAIAAARELLGR